MGRIWNTAHWIWNNAGLICEVVICAALAGAVIEYFDPQDRRKPAGSAPSLSDHSPSVDNVSSIGDAPSVSNAPSNNNTPSTSNAHAGKSRNRIPRSKPSIPGVSPSSPLTDDEKTISSPVREEVKKKSKLEQLPPELHRQIIQSLSPAEAVLVGLTCKTLWACTTSRSSGVVNELQRCSSLGQILHFLHMLEKNFPDQILCTACLRLHKRRESSLEVEAVIATNLFSSCRAQRPCAEELGGIYTFGPFNKRLVVQREAVELILRRLQLGDRFGLPLSALSHDLSWEAFGPCRTTVHLRTEAVAVNTRIRRSSESIEGHGACHLLLAARYRLEVDMRRSLKEQIKATSLGACDHDRFEAINSMAQFLESAKAGDLMHGRSLYQCEVCPSDTLVTVKRTPGEVFMAVNVSIIRDLGSRGDHKGGPWELQSSKYPVLPFSRAGDGSYAFGTTDLHELFVRAVKIMAAEQRLDAEGTGSEAETKA